MVKKIESLKINFLGLSLVLLVIFFPSVSSAQEFDCEVNINDRQISGSSYDYLPELTTDIENYINNYRWTNDSYQEHEQIQCSMQVVLTGVDSDFNYTAEMVLSARRPIYNTIQQTVQLLLTDNNWRFHYPRNKSLLHDDLQFDTLSSFLDFYANIMLAFDYDTLSELGGTPYLNRAQNIFDLGQNSGSQGWGRSIGAQRNRFGLITDLSNPAYEDLRRASYIYHRLGLDRFTTTPNQARQSALEALSLIRDAKRVTSNNYLFDLFFGSKYTEVVAMFQGAPVEQRTEAYTILREADPANSSEYEKLQTGF